jgi:hypothetical protein
MAEQWRYRVLGQEFGPVSLEALQDLLRSGTLGADDEVARESDPWRPAATVAGLSQSAEPDSTPLSDDLAAMLESVGDPGEAAGAPAAMSRATWYCRTLGEELGPFEFDRLLGMVRDGELSPTDEIRRGGDGRWERADAIVGLFSTESPDGEHESPGGADEAGWYVEAGKAAQGPLSFDELKRRVVEGSLGERDRVREGANGRWLRAATVVGLFDHRVQARSITGQAELAAKELANAGSGSGSKADVAATNPEAAATATSQEAASPETPPRNPQEDRWSNFFEKVEQREQKKWNRLPQQTSPAAPAGAASSAAEPAKAAPAESVESPAAPVAAPPPPIAPPQLTPTPKSQPSGPAFVAPPKPRRSLQMPSLGLGGLFERMKESGSGINVKSLALLGIAALALAAMYVPWPFGSVAGSEQYAEIARLWDRTVELYESKAGTEAWSALQQEALPIMDAAQEQLAPVVDREGRNAPLAQHLLWMVDSREKNGPTKSDGFLRKILNAGPAADEKDLRSAVSTMRDVHRYAPDNG